MPTHDPDTCLFTVTTERFVPGTLVMLGTFLEHHPRFGGDVVIVHDGLPEALRRVLAGSFRRVRFEPVSDELRARLERLAALPVFHDRLPNFYFLEAFRLGGYRKMLYFDSDLLFRAPIGELFDSNATLLCCPARDSLLGRRLDAATFLPIGEPARSGPPGRGRREGDPPADGRAVLEDVFNAGFLLVDGRVMGEAAYSELLAGVSPERLRDVRRQVGDQTLLNWYFAGRRTMIGSTYNFLVPHAALIRKREGLDAADAKVLHFKGPVKPWMLDAMLDKVDGGSGHAPTPHFKLWYGAWLDCITGAHLRNRHRMTS